MGVWSAIKSAAHGDFKGAVNVLYLDEENAARAAKAEAIGEKLNNDRYQAGQISWEELQQRNDRIESGTTQAMLSNPESSPYEGFKQGATEGLSRVQDGIKATLAAPFSFTWKVIPWQVWLVAGLYIGWKLGWIQKLLGAPRK